MNLQPIAEIPTSIRKWNPYPSYKDSGVEWLGNIPKHWKVKRVKAITSAHKQGYYTEQAYLDDGVKLARITDIDDSANVSFGNMPFVEVSLKDERAFALEKGDFLFARSGTIGRFGLVLQPERSVFASYLIRFRFRECDAGFLRFAFSSHFFKESLISTLHGGANQNVHAENIKERFLAIPPPPEQGSIAAFLDRETSKIDALVAKKERLIELLQEKRAALIIRAVTKGLDPNVPMKDSGVEWLGEIPAHWEVIKTKFVARLESGHTPSRQHPEYWENCTIPWFSLADVWQIRDGRKEYISDTEEKVSELGLAHSAARLLPKGTVILSRTASVGFSAIMATDMATTQDFVNWVCGPRIEPEYLLYVFRAMEHEFRRLTMGSTHQTIYMPDVEKFSTPLPPKNEQTKMVEFIRTENSKIDALIAKVREGIEKLNEYRTGLISAAVTGKIDVRDGTSI